jgi:hypothetical protein
MSATVTLPRPLAAESGAHARLRLRPEWLGRALYTFVVAYAIPFHEPWADEAQAWQIARALSVHDLFFHALRYEGTPGLWHLLLRGLILLHVSYTQMHWIVGFIAVCGMSLLIFFAPFPRWVRLSLPFTVFFAYQWAVVARSYVLVPLLTFAAAMFWKRSIAVAILLGLLANTSLHGFALAAGLAIVYFVETRRGLHPAGHHRAAFVILLAFLGFAIFTALPPPSDLTFSEILVHESQVLRFEGAIPLAVLYLLRAASYSWLLNTPIVILVAWIIYRAAGALYLLPLLSVALLSGFGYWGYWHLGFASVAVIASAWIGWRSCSTSIRLASTTVLVVWLAVQLSYSAFALGWDHKFSYSPDKAAAQYLRHFVDQKLPLAVTFANTNDVGDFHSIGLAPYFDRPIFLNHPRLYWLWSEKEHTDQQFEAALRQNPVAVVAIFRSDHSQHFEPSRDLDTRRLHKLYQQGYGVTHTFCGARPEAFLLREQICELVLER